MNRIDTIKFLKRRTRILAEQARRHPETAQMAYGYLEQVRLWSRRNRNDDLAAATREAKNHIIGVAI